jgi:hypothetical protein
MYAKRLDQSVCSSAAHAADFSAVAQREALQLVPLPVVALMRLAAVASRAARDAELQVLAALACADAAAGESAHRAARPCCRAALAASMHARAGVVLLRSWLQVLDHAVATSSSSLVIRRLHDALLLQRLQRTSTDSGSFVSANELC